MSFVKDWEKTKKDFAAEALRHLQAAGASIPADAKAALVTFIKTDTGMTPALKEVDAAFDKKQRKPAMIGLTKVHGIIERLATQIMRVVTNFAKAADAAGLAKKEALAKEEAAAAKSAGDLEAALSDVHDNLQMAGLTFNKALTKLETEISRNLETLQEVKSPSGAKIAIISLEGDMNGAIDNFKKESKSHTNLEKQHKVTEATAAMAKAMQAYSKAAARTEVQNSLTALQDFMGEVDKFDIYRKKVVAAVTKAATPLPEAIRKSYEVYTKAVNSLCDALKTIKEGRGKVSLKNLRELLAAGH